MFKPVKTPCIGICSTAIGDDVCRGCKRFAHEVVNWNAYTQEQRLLIVRRLDLFLVRVLANLVEIFDSRLLLEGLCRQQIAFDVSRDPHCWVYTLLKAGASQIERAEDFGFRIQPASRVRDLPGLRDMVEERFLELSRAHYQRYLQAGMSRQSA